MPETPLKLVGAPGSPYTRKLRAVLRYRRIPHRFVIRGSREDADTPTVPVSLIPILVFPGRGDSPDEAGIDSTPLIRRLERDFDDRAVVPPDPGLAFVDALLEDYADEWVTKAMFHYRWVYEADIQKAGAVLPLWRGISQSGEALANVTRFICERQIGRLGVVGSNATTLPVIESSYRRLLRALDRHLEQHPFLMGARPGSSDFALFGQLTQLVQFDPTPAAVALEESPRVIAWLDLVEDLSGLETFDADWLTLEELPESSRALLREVGRVYAPFLLANADALERGAERVECEIDGRKWEQDPFPYQGKCLLALREAYAALASGDRQRVDGALAGSGCETLFA